MTIELAKEDEYMLGALFGGDASAFTEYNITDVIVEEIEENEPDDDDIYTNVYGIVQVNRTVELDFIVNLPVKDIELPGECKIHLHSGHVLTVNLWKHQYYIMRRFEDIASKAIIEKLDDVMFDRRQTAFVEI